MHTVIPPVVPPVVTPTTSRYAYVNASCAAVFLHAQVKDWGTGDYNALVSQ
jgi:hypothetical protein